MGIPARAARPLVALAIAAASLGCIAHPAYAENATAAVVSDDGSHIVVDVDLNGGASDVGSDRQGAEKDSQGESVSDTETDKTMKAFEGLNGLSRYRGGRKPGPVVPANEVVYNRAALPEPPLNEGKPL